MPKVENIYTQVLDATGTVVSINPALTYQRYIFTGSGSLTGNITISPTDGSTIGTIINIQWNCTFTDGGSKVIIFSKDIEESLIGKNFNIEAVYNGSTWDVALKPDFIQSQIINANNIIDSTITGSKLASSTVDISNLTSNSKLQQTILEISFESGEQVNNTIKMSTAFTLNSIYYEVIKALTNTDVGTITPKINSTGVTLSSAISIPLSTVINTTGSTNCTALNIGVANDLVSFVAAKTTAGGKVRLTLNWSKA